jgi:hypothetical protein
VTASNDRRASARLALASPRWLHGFLAVGVAAGLFVLAAAHGTYGLTARSTMAILLWWTVAVVIVLYPRVIPIPTRLTIAMIGALTALAVLTAASIAWAADTESAFEEVDRVLLYLGLSLFVVIVARRRTVAAWCDGLTFAMSAVVVAALVSRFFPSLLPASQPVLLISGAEKRLSYPLGYWNALAALIAMGLPLLLRGALTTRWPALRGLALALVPAFVCALYLTSSRGGVACAAVAVLVYFGLERDRFAVLGALAIASLGSLAALKVVADRQAVVNGPFDGHLAAMQGRQAALALVVICVLTGATYALACRFSPRFSIPAAAQRSLLIVTVLGLIAATLAAHPVRRLNAFRASPIDVTGSTSYVNAHLLNVQGNGRWELWSAAVAEFRHYGWLGGGAGSFHEWWKQHGTLAQFVRDAHSLYLQSLAELGMLGLLLTLSVVAVGVVATAKTVRSSHDSTVPALGAAFLAWAVAAGIDWMWELTVVTAIGIVILGLLVTAAGPARTRSHLESRRIDPDRSRNWLKDIPPVAFRWAAVAIAVCAVALEAIPMLTQERLDASHAAVAAGNPDAATRAALDAKSIEPWAASPYLQLALVQERQGHLRLADQLIHQAIGHSSRDWTLWLVATRVEAKLGLVVEARRSLAHVRTLNPRAFPTPKG